MLRQIQNLLGQAPPDAWRPLLGADVFPATFGRLLARSDEEARLTPMLDAIPSETSPGERRFLFHFMKHIWDGQGDVVEVGPFLGGTTRALAQGMLENDRRVPEARLRTYDRFDDYYQPDALSRFIQPLVANGALPPSFQSLSSRRFKDLVDAIHAAQPYAALLEARVGALQDDPHQAHADAPFAYAFDRPLGVVFVDGCKSWHGTKHFVREVAPACRPGTYVIFQDYAWYTCFWVPAFVETFASHLQLLATVDNTYTFQLTAPLDASLIDEAFPERPESIGVAGMAALFDRIVHKAALRGDLYGALAGSLQRAAALAYLGERGPAGVLIDQLAAVPAFAPWRDMIQAARRRPTYRPDGPVCLD